MSEQLSLTQLARAGCTELDRARENLLAASDTVKLDAELLLDAVSEVADPDRALDEARRLLERHPTQVEEILRNELARERFLRVLGASRGLAEFLGRQPQALSVFCEPEIFLAEAHHYYDAQRHSAHIAGQEGRTSLRVTYREQLLRIAIVDLMAENPLDIIPQISEALADIAGAAIDAAVGVGKADLLAAGSTAAEVDALQLAVIGMGKCGARELNYISDVDVIFVVESTDDDALSGEKLTVLGTKLAQLVMKGIHELGPEPGLWEVDANLRPEGKAGALVRTLESHLTYYDRWAKNWEFQALLKARPLAGNRELGERYVAELAPKVWSSSTREGFVDQVQRMRERVTEHIPANEVDWQIKLGPGGLRDIEFTVQLLQLVHGRTDATVRLRGTLETLSALSEGGYVGRAEALSFAEHYRYLRLLEHRLQMREMHRTHLMPQNGEAQRILARSSGQAANADALLEQWRKVKRDVRALHEKLFYRPLLAAVAQVSDDPTTLSAEQAEDRLAAIGFRDPSSALGHIAALTQGVSRRAAIQRSLLPVMLQWFAEGADPDHGLLSFRRLSEALGESHWYLRMLRDSAGAAERMTQALSSSRFICDLLETIPEAAAWFENNDDLRPREFEALENEASALIGRHEDDPEEAASALKFLRRREVLRLALAGIVDAATIEEIATGLSDITTIMLRSILTLVTAQAGDVPEFAIIAMGRYGGAELGFGSDADVLFVYRPRGTDTGGTDENASAVAQKAAEAIVARIRQLTADERLAFEIDIDLRPEGKNGPVVRSLDSYAAYYERWSLTWEAQALLRARDVAGDPDLRADFMELANKIRYPEELPMEDVREIRRIKARVEKERLPQGADPNRHIKLGRGSLSDVEWTVQLIQLQHAAHTENLRTPSTLQALNAAVDDELITAENAEKLAAAWLFSSRVRSAITIWSNRSSDVLPTDRRDLEGVARLLGYPAGSASQLEDDYLGVTRRSRAVFEKVFYGE